MNNVFENIPYQKKGMGNRKLVDEKDSLIMQIALQPGQSVPEHKANSNVHLLVLKGVLSVNLDGQDNTIVEGGILPVDFRTPMKIINNSQENTTFLVIKTPNSSEMEK